MCGLCLRSIGVLVPYGLAASSTKMAGEGEEVVVVAIGMSVAFHSSTLSSKVKVSVAAGAGSVEAASELHSFDASVKATVMVSAASVPGVCRTKPVEYQDVERVLTSTMQRWCGRLSVDKGASSS